ncbi:MAG: GNAT family N-acetyltransferase [Pisciglobus halotolerans]|nr:GNAT family N-acetyltransferase [Pisciglobus halotolerans]
MNYRILKAEHLNEMLELAYYAFNQGPENKIQKELKILAFHSTVYGAFEKERLKSQLLVARMNVSLHTAEIPMGGVAFVSSYPEVRGSGNITTLMKRALEGMRQDGMLLSYLAPFSYSFYRQYGYEHVFDQTTYEMNKNDLPQFSNVKGTMERVRSQNEAKQVRDLYQERYTHSVGPLKREEWIWELKWEQHKDQKAALYFDKEGSPAGYILYHFSAREESVFTIDEMVYLSHEAFKGLWQFVAAHISSFETFSYTTGINEKLTDLFKDPTMKQSLKPSMMARIVDFPAFILHYPFLERAQAVFYLEVKDDFAKWNEGLWKVELRPTGNKIEKVAIRETVDPSKIISGTIQHWTCFFMQSRDSKKMHVHHQIEAHEKIFQELVDRMPDGDPELYDDF